MSRSVSAILKLYVLNILTNYIEHSPSWEQILLQPVNKSPHVHYLIHKSSPHVPILSQINPVQNLPPCSFRINFNIIFHLRLGFRNVKILFHVQKLPARLVHATFGSACLRVNNWNVSTYRTKARAAQISWQTDTHLPIIMRGITHNATRTS